MSDNTTYHILEVYDYKGGELSVNLNLDRINFIHSLTDVLRFDKIIEDYIERYQEDSDEDLPDEVSTWAKALAQEDLLDQICDNTSEYAGAEGSVWEIYECNHNVLTGIQLTQELVDECVKCYIDYFMLDDADNILGEEPFNIDEDE